MIQLSTETKTDIALQLEGYVEGAIAPAINLIFTNQYTQEVTTYRTVYPIVTGRASQMEIDELTTYAVGMYVIVFEEASNNKILATQLAYISGTDVIGESDFDAYEVGDARPDIVYPNT